MLSLTSVLMDTSRKGGGMVNDSKIADIINRRTQRLKLVIDFVCIIIHGNLPNYNNYKQIKQVHIQYTYAYIWNV